MRLEPLFARVIVRRETFTKSSGGIIIPDEAAKRHAKARGEVIAIGPDVDPSIKVGKTYVFGKYAGGWLDSDFRPTDRETEGEYYVLQDEDLIAEVCDA